MGSTKEDEKSYMAEVLASEVNESLLRDGRVLLYLIGTRPIFHCLGTYREIQTNVLWNEGIIVINLLTELNKHERKLTDSAFVVLFINSDVSSYGADSAERQ